MHLSQRTPYLRLEFVRMALFPCITVRRIQKKQPIRYLSAISLLSDNKILRLLHGKSGGVMSGVQIIETNSFEIIHLGPLHLRPRHLRPAVSKSNECGLK